MVVMAAAVTVQISNLDKEVHARLQRSWTQTSCRQRVTSPENIQVNEIPCGQQAAGGRQREREREAVLLDRLVDERHAGASSLSLTLFIPSSSPPPFASASAPFLISIKIPWACCPNQSKEQKIREGARS